MRSLACVLGVDLGEQHVNAVVVDRRRNLLGAASCPREEELVAAVGRAVDEVLAAAGARPEDVLYAVVASDHCLRAVRDRQGLARVAVIRLASPEGATIPPLFEWPADLAAAIGGTVYQLSGGFELDGRPIKPGPEDGRVAEVAEEIRRRGLDGAAVSGVFSPAHQYQEVQLAARLREALSPEFLVTLSHGFGSIGLLERENTTALNASLAKVGPMAGEALSRALSSRGSAAQIFVAQNDGTVMALPGARRFPILTVRSVSAHTLRGAAYLSGLDDGVVLACGGDHVDVGRVAGGFPRESLGIGTIAGVRVSVPLPDMLTIPLGEAPEGDSLPGLLLERLENALDRVKGTPEPVPVIGAGPCAYRLPERLRGTSRVIRPVHGAFAGAISAAIAPVGGRADGVYSLDRWTREGALADTERRAREWAVEAGADPGTLAVTRVDEVALTYLPGNVLRIRVKVTGYPAVSGLAGSRMT